MTSITPIRGFAGTTTEQAKSQTFEKQQKKKEFSDPLLKWPLRGLAFTNDIGAAIMDIAPKAGMMFWVPALMYFGADIYDKYKNDKASYDPNAKRGLKQALFQTFASIIFPIAAVHAGQKAASISARLGGQKLSLQTQNEIIEHQLKFMSHKKLSEYTADTYKAQYGKALDNYMEEISRSRKTKNPLKMLMNFIFGHKHPENLDGKRKNKIHEYINKRIDNIYANRELLLENKKPEQMSEKMFKKLQDLKEIYKKDPANINDYNSKAVKDILKNIESNKIFKIKLLKTLGGFVALGLLIQPIDKFVEHIIIEKFVEPGLNMFNTKEINDFKEKLNFKGQQSTQK